MSWDATLTDDRGHVEGEWNYTHNCNRMANDALDVIGYDRPHDDREVSRRDPVTGEWKTEPYGPKTWWHILDGMSGADGAQYLTAIITQLEAEPDRYRAMNPENEWGDYDSFRFVLREMRDRVPEWPSLWRVHG